MYTFVKCGFINYKHKILIFHKFYVNYVVLVQGYNNIYQGRIIVLLNIVVNTIIYHNFVHLAHHKEKLAYKDVLQNHCISSHNNLN